MSVLVILGLVAVMFFLLWLVTLSAYLDERAAHKATLAGWRSTLDDWQADLNERLTEIARRASR